MKNKYLLCRPQGGLNDMLCQIEKCCRYAELTKRVVIVDTNYQHSSYFKDDLCNYFQSNQNKLILSIRGYEKELEKLSVSPSFLQGVIFNYETVLPDKNLIHLEAKTKLPITFDFSRDHDEDLLIYHQMGGGDVAFVTLLRMRLKDSLLGELEKRYQLIGENFSAIHIRNTDYESSYDEVLGDLKCNPPEKLFLATDNSNVLADFRSALERTEIFSFSKSLSGNKEPIHVFKDMNFDQIKQRNEDAILDLLLLALSSKLYLVKIKKLYFNLGRGAWWFI